ncbi:hypothetical protein QL995_21300 [Pseudoalteromonas sp. APC 3358]|uniref:hypothetical protein n=1 Tax=Pseudoalteromonas sp. APC 3358 TaxID=3035176 RepID=UPI0025B56CF0|nr:hypothetical protein [Pseudoalteromonas sp. APC 3358]MDN3385161.1 hypothetical protein [Pseudoalteromonas sp. APC 3358]
MDFYQYLPAIITAFLIAPLGYYVREKLKNLATNEDFGKAIKQLEDSTKTVESIKNQLNEKYWVQQQIWETKRLAYEEIITCLFLTKKSVQSWVDYFSEFTDCYVYIGGSSCIEYDEEYERSYSEYVESQQTAFQLKYESKEACLERNKLMTETKSRILELEDVFSIKSLYLHGDINLVEEQLMELRKKLFEKDIKQDDYENNSDFYEAILDNYVECGKLVSRLIEQAKAMASGDLRLEP